ncbi:MAG TPA: hypothetical protein VGS41_16630 [Chthonomonadales bacterium]|nr:hypothetical protein [Chthonomonadales bacterium]
MRDILKALGGYPLYGVLAVVSTAIAFFALDYLRLSGAARWSAYLPLVRRIAVAAAIVSVVLIASRFLAVEIL